MSKNCGVDRLQLILQKTIPSTTVGVPRQIRRRSFFAGTGVSRTEAQYTPIASFQWSFYRYSSQHTSSTNLVVANRPNRSIMLFSSSTHPQHEQLEQKVGIVEQTIREKLLEALSPVVHLTILNESHRHNVPLNSETHFKVVVVSSKFESVPTLVGRHRLVNTILADELSSSGPIHALSIVAKTPAQWSTSKQNGMMEPSPACRGGDGSLPPKS